MTISIYTPLAIFEQGLRERQEDALFPRPSLATENDSLFVLCDGMGGHHHSEMASNLVCNNMPTYIHKHWDGRLFTDELLAQALKNVQSSLDKLDDGSFKKPGTTLSLLCLHSGGVLAAHIGDSRIYHIRPRHKRILYKSRDHSLVYDMLVSGEITQVEMANYAHKNVLTRALLPSLERSPRADITHIADIQADDYFLMCSDGLLEKMSDEQLLELLCSKKTDEEKKMQLIKATSDNRDNHSAYLIRVKKVVRDSSDAHVINDEQSVSWNVASTPQVHNKKGLWQKIRDFCGL